MHTEHSPVLRAPTPWRFDFDMYFTFEIDLDAISVRPPRGMFYQEIRPGVGLIGVGFTLGEPGNLGVLPGFVEINWAVGLQSDLSRDMPLPRFSVMTGRIAADNTPFLDHAEQVDKMVVHRSQGLRAQVDRERMAVAVEDEHGPIFSMWSTHTGVPDYRPRTEWLQLGSRQGEGWFQAIRWQGKAWEHQQDHRAGRFHDHPFFEGIDVSGLGDQCYMQMLAQPGQAIEVDFFTPVPLRRRP